MYTTCLTCHLDLGTNEEISSFPVGERLAFDAQQGRLWVVCPHCGRWNLSALDERWEAIEACEKLFRSTHLRLSTDNIGMAERPSGLTLVRIGEALRPEIAAWRYGHRLVQRRNSARPTGFSLRRGVARLANSALSALGEVVGDALPRLRLDYDAATWWRIHRQNRRLIDAMPDGRGGRMLVYYRHLEGAELIRPSRNESWRLVIQHDTGPVVLSGEEGVRSAGKLLAALNGFGWTGQHVESAVRRLEDAGNPEGYFARIAALAWRTGWGQSPTAPRDDLPILPAGASQTEKLALLLTNRSFWARGGIGSEPSTVLPRLPVEDRLALEMAANEDTERRALEGELAELEAAWREAEEIAAIADSLFVESADASALEGWKERLRRSLAAELPDPDILPGRSRA